LSDAGDTVMAQIEDTYNEQLNAEIQRVPSEYLPALLTIVHSFRESVSLPTAAESFEEGWKDVMTGNTRPIETLWDGIDAS
jgi:N-formylglutamate amidohydrolase